MALHLLQTSTYLKRHEFVSQNHGFVSPWTGLDLLEGEPDRLVALHLDLEGGGQHAGRPADVGDLQVQCVVRGQLALVGADVQ